jgi:hypothetical protein
MCRDTRLKKDRGLKTETLSLRLDPRTKFSLEFAGLINGQTQTVIVERAIRSACNAVTIDLGEGETPNWTYFWDPDEGVRMLKLLYCPSYPASYDHDELKLFIEAHAEFFYLSFPTNWLEKQVNRAFVQVLWPKIEQYRRIWREKREINYWAAGEAMTADLSAAKLKAPTWPRPDSFWYPIDEVP